MAAITKRGIAIVLGLLVTAAVVVTSLSCAGRLPEDAAAATAVVSGWVPIGTPVDAARKTLEDHGFDVFVHPPRSQHNPTDEEHLWADRMQTAGWPVMRRHQVSAVLVDGRVTKLVVHSGLVGP